MKQVMLHRSGLTRRMGRLLMVCILLFPLAETMSQPVCEGYPSNWGRRLTASSYAWHLDMNLQTVFRTDDTIIPEADIREDIRHAIERWTSAANLTGQVIQFDEEGSQSNVLTIRFVQLINEDPGICGEAGIHPTTPLILLKSSGWYSSSGGGVHLRTTILHEMGHIFLGVKPLVHRNRFWRYYESDGM
jgi:hypothetical protein